MNGHQFSLPFRYSNFSHSSGYCLGNSTNILPFPAAKEASILPWFVYTEFNSASSQPRLLLLTYLVPHFVRIPISIPINWTSFFNQYPQPEISPDGDQFVQVHPQICCKPSRYKPSRLKWTGSHSVLLHRQISQSCQGRQNVSVLMTRWRYKRSSIKWQVGIYKYITQKSADIKVSLVGKDMSAHRGVLAWSWPSLP